MTKFEYLCYSDNIYKWLVDIIKASVIAKGYTLEQLTMACEHAKERACKEETCYESRLPLTSHDVHCKNMNYDDNTDISQG